MLIVGLLVIIMTPTVHERVARGVAQIQVIQVHLGSSTHAFVLQNDFVTLTF